MKQQVVVRPFGQLIAVSGGEAPLADLAFRSRHTVGGPGEGLKLGKASSCIWDGVVKGVPTALYFRGDLDRLIRRLTRERIPTTNMCEDLSSIPFEGRDPCGVRRFVRRRGCGIIDCICAATSDARIIHYAVTADLPRSASPANPRPTPRRIPSHITKTFVVLSNRSEPVNAATGSLESGEVTPTGGHSTLLNTDRSQRLVRELRNLGLRAADRFAGDNIDLWQPQSGLDAANAESAKLIETLTEPELDDWIADQEDLFPDGKPKSVFPDVVTGSWGDLKQLARDGITPDLVFVVEPLSVASKPAIDALEILNPKARLFAIVRDYDRLAESSKDLIRCAYGRRRRRMGTLGGRPVQPTTVVVVPGRLPKPIKNPQNCKSEAQKIARLSRDVRRHVGRNHCIARVARTACADLAGSAHINLPQEAVVPDGRVAIVVENDEHVANVLRHLSKGWFGVVATEYQLRRAVGRDELPTFSRPTGPNQ